MIAPALAKKRTGRRENTRHPEANVVVPVVGFVPVAVRRAEVVWIVVPGTAANHAG
jgi:hypothetical protein